MWGRFYVQAEFLCFLLYLRVEAFPFNFDYYILHLEEQEKRKLYLE